MASTAVVKSEPSLETILSAFHAGKVIDENVTLKQLAAVSARLKETIGGGDDDALWTFVSKHYVYKGDSVITAPPKS